MNFDKESKSDFFEGGWGEGGVGDCRFHANQTTKCLRNLGRTKGEGWSTEN